MKIKICFGLKILKFLIEDFDIFDQTFLKNLD